MSPLWYGLSVRHSPACGGGWAAHWRHVIVSWDVAVDGEVVVVLAVLLWRMTKGTLALWKISKDEDNVTN